MTIQKNITVEEWVEYAKQGFPIPITTVLHGISMEPLIRYKKDKVTIVPIKTIQEGDIVLFERSDGAYVVHRVFSIKDTMVQTWGDNCAYADAPIPISKVLGHIISVEKNGKVIELDTPFQRQKGIEWMRGSFKRKYYFYFRRNVKRVLSKIKRVIWNQKL